MINSFRSFFQSKLGLGLTLAFLGIIALAFASMDVSSTGTFGGLSGTNSVAVVGDESVSTAELRESANNSFREVQGNDPTLTMEQFLEEGGLSQVFNTLLDRVSVSEFGRILGDMTKASDSLGTGPVREAVLSLARATLIFHAVDEDLILVLALRPDGNLGKARYLIRRNLPQLRAEL